MPRSLVLPARSCSLAPAPSLQRPLQRPMPCAARPAPLAPLLCSCSAPADLRSCVSTRPLVPSAALPSRLRVCCSSLQSRELLQGGAGGKMAEKGDRYMAHLEAELPFGMEALVLPSEDKRVGLVIVDEVNGFCTVGAGLLAPTESMEAVTEMVKQTDYIARQFSARNWPIIAFLDTHEEGKPEDPYPRHCIVGTGEENLVPELLWLESDPNTTLMRKDCINGFVGGMRDNGSNIVVDWIKDNNVQQMLVVGICTDICVMDFVLTTLSARNHGIMKPLEDVFVYSEACATYHLPNDIAKNMKPPAFPHPQDITHYMGLYFARSRGARVVNKVTLLEPSP